jgi:hypothetical protein
MVLVAHEHEVRQRGPLLDLVPVPFFQGLSAPRPYPKKGDWLRCAKHPKGRQATVPVLFFQGLSAPRRCPRSSEAQRSWT